MRNEEYIIKEHPDFPYEEPKPPVLIRCKDCKYWDVSKSNIMNHTCHWGYFLKKEDDYCSWAEPKDTTEEVRKQLKDMEQRREMDRKK